MSDELTPGERKVQAAHTALMKAAADEADLILRHEQAKVDYGKQHIGASDMMAVAQARRAAQVLTVKVLDAYIDTMVQTKVIARPPADEEPAATG